MSLLTHGVHIPSLMGGYAIIVEVSGFGSVLRWVIYFLFPAIVVDRIEGMCHTFFVGIQSCRVSWHQVCTPKDEGGLSLRDLSAWNKSLLPKKLWDKHTQKETLWVNEFFLRGCPIMEWTPHQDAPPLEADAAVSKGVQLFIIHI